jgi:Domain of unknown function (DUF1918)
MPDHSPRQSSARGTARVGDRLVIQGHHEGEPKRDAEILEVRGPDGGPPYRVRWQDDGHESIYYPGSDSFVQHVSDRGSR